MSHAAFLRFSTIAASVLVVSASGCAGAGWGTLADVLAAGGGLGGQDVNGEIRRIDTRRQEIELNPDWGNTQRVAYDSRTQVLYGQRRYDIRSLERGDRVSVRVAPNRGNVPYATVIQVEQDVSSERLPPPARDERVRQRFEGNVTRVDTRAGWFDLDQGRGRVVRIALPYPPTRVAEDRFLRLRRGDFVRVEASVVRGGDTELIRFL